MIEEWKPIEWYEGLYEISNLWRVKSLNFYNRWYIKILKYCITNKWYSRLCLRKWRWNIKMNNISRLVAIHFIPNPENKPFACHKNETLDKNWALYNWSDNLFWGTHTENMRDMIKKWRDNCNFKTNHPIKWKFWKNHPKSRKIDQYTKDWIFVKTWDSMIDASRALLINNAHLCDCCKLHRKSAGWFIWKYN